MKHKFAIIIAVIIFILSTIPLPEVPDLGDVPFIDKWVHFVMYGSLTFAMYLDRKLSKAEANTTFILAAFFLPSLYGGILELVQKYCTTCRSGEWLDFYADTFGAFLATIISLLIWKIAKTLEQR